MNFWKFYRRIHPYVMPVADAGIGLSYIVTGLMDGNNWYFHCCRLFRGMEELAMWEHYCPQ
jgi:hypothetical protein